MRCVASTPHEERIRKRAEEIYQARLAAGMTSAGDAVSDWLQAEEEIEEEESHGKDQR